MENEIYQKCEDKIKILVQKIDKIKEQRNFLERKISEWCLVRDEDDRNLQKIYYKRFKTIEIIEKQKRKMRNKN